MPSQSNRTIIVVALVIITLTAAAMVLTPALFANQSTLAGEVGPGESAGTGGPVDFNRSINSISVRPSSAGGMVVDVGYSLVVGEGAAGLTLESLLVLEVIVEGKVVSTSSLAVPFDIEDNDAILCAVQCSSDCGSIFGDGVCAGCNCNYESAEPFPLPAPLQPGHMVRASFVHTVGPPDPYTDDDELLVTFGVVDPIICPEDLNGDGTINVLDLLILLGAWGQCS